MSRRVRRRRDITTVGRRENIIHTGHPRQLQVRRQLRHRAERSGTSIRALIIRAIEQAYSERKKGQYVTGPLVSGRGQLGAEFPEDENPHDFVYS